MMQCLMKTLNLSSYIQKTLINMKVRFKIKSVKNKEYVVNENNDYESFHVS